MRKLLTILLIVSLQCFGQYPIKNFLKADCHNWDMIAHPQQAGSETITANLQKAILSTFTGLRVYSDATVIKDANNLTFMFSPDGRGYETDKAITQLKAVNPNLTILYCYQNAPKNIQGEWQAAGKKSTQYRHLNSYDWSGLASDMSVIAARGGSNTNVPDYPLFVSPNWWDTKQQMLKGAKLYDIIEPGNEYDNNWSNDEPLNAAQYYVLWKSVYDAVKKVDPSIKVSTTGVMTENPQVLADVLSLGAPFDVYQFHCYPWGWSKNIANALPPEMNMIPAAKKVVAVSKGIPCIIGEWGYDLHPLSDIGIRPFSNYTAEQVRSFWVERSILGFARSGIESAYYYRIYQDYGLVNDSNPTAFETSSLFIKDDQNNITRRLSGDVFANLSQYGDYVFDKVFAEDSVVVYRFKNGLNYLYTGWTVEKVQLVTINGVNRASFTERKINYTFPDGQTRELSSKPIKFVASTALPVKDKPNKPTPKPKKYYNVRVYDFMGVLIIDKENVEIEEVKKQLPRHRFFIINYYNNQENKTEKLFKQ